MRYPIANYISPENFFVSHKNFPVTLRKVIELKYIQEAVKNPLWRNTMAKEIHALDENKTELQKIYLHQKKNPPISYKWAYHVKYNSNGSIQRYKAWSVIHGDCKS